MSSTAVINDRWPFRMSDVPIRRYVAKLIDKSEYSIHGALDELSLLVGLEQ